VIEPPRFDAALDIRRELFAKSEIFCAYRAGGAQEQPDEPYQIDKDLDNCLHGLKHARIMPDLTYARSRSTAECRRHEYLRRTRATSRV